MTPKSTNKSCTRIRSKLVHYIEAELSDRETGLIAKHIETCKECRHELNILRQTLELVENETSAPKLAPQFRQELRSRILGLYHLQNTPAFITHHGLITVWKAFGPTILGVATSMLSIWPLFMSSLNLKSSPFGLLLCGMIWCGLYNALFFMYDRKELEKAFGREPEDEINLRVILLGTLACIVFLVLASVASVHSQSLLPNTVLPNFWEAPARFLGYFSAVAVMLTALGVGRLVQSNPMGNMFLVCVIYCMLVFPSFFVTSTTSFSALTTFSSVATVFGSGWLGCFIGVFLGQLELRRKTSLSIEDEDIIEERG